MTKIGMQADGKSNRLLTTNTHHLPRETHCTPLRPRARQCGLNRRSRGRRMAGVTVKDRKVRREV